MKILIPTDFSDASNNASFYGLELAKDQNAEIYLFHSNILPDSDPFTPAFAHHSAGNVEIEYQKLISDQMEEVKERLAKSAGGKVQVQNLIEVGNPVTTMAEQAEHKNIDLIVVGRAAEDDEEEFYATGNILKIIDEVETPVLVVPQSSTYKKPAKIVYATDEDEDDLDPIVKMMELAKQYNAQLIVLHVKNKNSNNSNNKDSFREKVKKVAPYDKLSFETIENEDVTEGLRAYITNNQCDMICMHKHRRNFIERIFSDSITKEMASKTDIPLMVYH